MARFRRFFLRALVAVAGLVLVSVLALVGVKLWCDARAFHGYDPSAPLAPETTKRRPLPGGRAERIEIAGVGGERFPLQLLLPDAGEAPYPCVVLLYGIGQRMSFFDDIAPFFAERGVALAVPEQYGRGVRKQAGAKARALAFQTRCARIVPETRRVVDYLMERDDIDPARIDLFGASYGGILGCAAMRHEPRFRSGVISLAGGSLPELARHFADHSDLGAARPPLAAFASWWLDAYEPTRHVGGIAPRPLLFVNLEKDELIPRRCTDALFDAAKEPKSQSWIEASHVEVDEFLVRRLATVSLDWLALQAPALAPAPK